MNRALVCAVYAYFGLGVAHWYDVARILNAPPGRLWCGNIVTDPYHLLTNKVTPIIALGIVTVALRRIRRRQQPVLPMLVLPVFLGTTAGLLYEAYWLVDYGFPFHVWWFPWL